MSADKNASKNKNATKSFGQMCMGVNMLELKAKFSDNENRDPQVPNLGQRLLAPTQTLFGEGLSMNA
jgi:hypothetical protein